MNNNLEDLRNYKIKFEALEKDAGPDYAKSVAAQKRMVETQKGYAKQARHEASNF